MGIARFQPVCGLLLIALIAYALSTNRKAIRLRTIAWGFSLQFLFAVIVLKTPYGQRAFEILGDRIKQLLGFATVGSSFVFGPIGDQAAWSRSPSSDIHRVRSNRGAVFPAGTSCSVAPSRWWAPGRSVIS